MDDWVTRQEFERFKERAEDSGRQAADDRRALERALGNKLDELKSYITEEFKELRDDLQNRYATKADLERVEKRAVSQDEFVPIRRIVYGAAGFILMAVLGAIVALVIGGGI